TRILFFLSDTIGYIAFIVVAGTAAFFLSFRSLKPEQRMWIWEQLYKVPFVGKLLLNLELSTVFMNFSMLNGGGIPVLETLPIVIEATPSTLIAERLRNCHDMVLKGG